MGSTALLHVSRNRPSAVVLVLSQRPAGPAVNVNVDGVVLWSVGVPVARVATRVVAVPVGPPPPVEDFPEVHCALCFRLRDFVSPCLVRARARGPVGAGGASHAFAWSCSQNSSFSITISLFVVVLFAAPVSVPPERASGSGTVGFGL